MILGVIPARGGSKGIPRKNLRLLHGKPLVVWSIEAALESRMLDDFIVSTDDEEIADVSIDAHAKVIRRPASLARDDSTTLDVLKHHLGSADIVALLQPTSPIRVNGIIDEAVRRFLDLGCDTLATGYRSTHVAWGSAPHGPRQKQPPYFHDDGCVYIFKREVIEAGKWIGSDPYQMVIPSIYNLEIDTEADFWAVEGIMRYVYPALAR